jgi:D-alanyl-D-alanine endopeptidase (penicillin-binding protein 7)
MKNFILTLLLLPILAFAQPSTIVYDVTNNRVIKGSLDNSEMSIASISKLMTVYTVLKESQDLNEVLEVTSKRTPNTKLSKGMKLSRIDLINLTLVSSDNLAAQTLSENFPIGYSYFISKMNQHSQDLNMVNTRFVEPTGLSPMNYSSLSDIILLVNAVHEFDIVKDAAKARTVTVHTVRGKKNIKITSNSTSMFFGKEGIVAIKTGFTKAAGFCITILVEADDRIFNITILGAKTKKERQLIVERFLKTIYNT